MKIISFLIFSLFALYALADPIDHLKLLKGFFEGLNTKENLDNLLVCSDETIVSEWQASVDFIKTVTDWNNPMNIMFALTKALKPAYLSIKSVLACSTADLPDLLTKLRKFSEDPTKVIKAVMDNSDILYLALPQIASLWDEQNYPASGKVVGALLIRIFTE